MKNQKKYSILFFTIILTGFVLSANLSGCNEQKSMIAIPEEKLFSLNYGNFEDELNLFFLKEAGPVNTKIIMKDGFFFISDDFAKKIMQFNFYGDLICVIYNPETNPPPSFAKKITDTKNSEDEDGSFPIRNSTQISQTYKFNKIENFTVDSHKNIYVVEQVSPENQEKDSEHNLALKDVVLRFSNDGTLIDYIGQEGPGGTPFPYIKNIFTTKNDELVVVCILKKEHIVFWFNKKGFLKWTIPIRWDFIPKPENESFVTIDKIVPDLSQPKLYIKTDYHKIYVDEESNIQSGIEYFQTLLHCFNIETEEFEKSMEIPPYEDVVVDRFSKLIYKTPFNFLGTTDSKYFFFAIPDETGFVIQIIQANGQKIIKRHISYNVKQTIYMDFCLSNSGIISALIANNEKTDVVWWRTDSLIRN
ncbi:MAG: LIC_12708 family protein [Treponemataceae bacterium]